MSQIYRELLQHVDHPKVLQSFPKWIKDKALITHAVIDKTYPISNPLNEVMKSVVPAESALRVNDVVKAVCKSGPCTKCEAMVLVTGRVCFGTYGGTLIDIPPVFGKARYDKDASSKICISFCNGNKNHPLKQEAAERRLAKRIPQTGGNIFVTGMPSMPLYHSFHSCMYLQVTKRMRHPHMPSQP